MAKHCSLQSREKNKQYQKERYRRAIADPVTRKQLREKKNHIQRKHVAKKRSQKLDNEMEQISSSSTGSTSEENEQLQHGNDLYVKCGTDEYMECWSKDPFKKYYGTHIPQYLKNQRTHPTKEETNDFWPVSSIEWMERYINDPKFYTFGVADTPMYKKLETEDIYIDAPDFVIQQKRRDMLWDRLDARCRLSRSPECLHSHMEQERSDFIERWCRLHREI